MAGRPRRVALSTVLFLVVANSILVMAPASAADERERRSQPIVIRGDAQFTAANGVRSGSGTRSDPYVISGWDVREVHIADTDSYVTIIDNTIRRLVLNWNGDRVNVLNNSVGDLRVNQNVRRSGAPTSGVIKNNRFDVVGQLRHFDGEFAYNRVGHTSSSLPFFRNRAVNFDGFHGAHFHHNTLYGYLEVRLHGHHHGSSYDAPSHHHGPQPSHGEGEHHAHDPAAPMTDHTKRYHEVFVHDNTIRSDAPFALVYTDSNHRGNDRTAASESNQELNKPHQHWTRVHLTNNKLIGAGLRVEYFNARDERHTNTNRGAVEIARNEILVRRDMNSDPFRQRDGISVYSSVDVDLEVVDNQIAYEESADPVTAATSSMNRVAGISLRGFDKADILIGRNVVGGFFYGVSARDMTASVFWQIVSLQTEGVAQPVSYDDSVRNRPRQGP